VRNLLLFYLVVDGTNIPVDLTSGKKIRIDVFYHRFGNGIRGKLSRCSEIFAVGLCSNGSARVFSEIAISRSDLNTKTESPVISRRSGHGSELERDGGRRSQNFCFSGGGEFEDE
jgi:hypothetical protein